MIVFDLSCDDGHRFEGWFRSTDDYSRQREDGLLVCPQCGSVSVDKAPSAPAVGRKGNQQLAVPQPVATRGKGRDVSNVPMNAEVQKALEMLAKAQARALEKSTWVGENFAEQSREMHYGERDAAPIHGRASIDEAERLIDEGIEVAPLPFPVAPPEDMN